MHLTLPFSCVSKPIHFVCVGLCHQHLQIRLDGGKLSLPVESADAGAQAYQSRGSH